MRNTKTKKFIVMSVEDLQHLIQHVRSNQDQGMDYYLAAASMLGSAALIDIDLTDDENSWSAFRRAINELS